MKKRYRIQIIIITRRQSTYSQARLKTPRNTMTHTKSVDIIQDKYQLCYLIQTVHHQPSASSSLESGRSEVRFPLAPWVFFSRVESHQRHKKQNKKKQLALQWVPCKAPGITESARVLVGPVAVYWVR